MRNLETQEVGMISGGLQWELNGVFVKVTGDGGDLIEAYDWAVGQASDFFTWWDPMGYYDRC